MENICTQCIQTGYSIEEVSSTWSHQQFSCEANILAAKAVADSATPGLGNAQEIYVSTLGRRIRKKDTWAPSIV